MKFDSLLFPVEPGVDITRVFVFQKYNLVTWSKTQAMGYKVHPFGRVVDQRQFLWLTFQKTC